MGCGRGYFHTYYVLWLDVGRGHGTWDGTGLYPVCPWPTEEIEKCDMGWGMFLGQLAR